MSTTRKEVMAELAKVAADAMARGEDGLKAVEAMGVPTAVAAEAWCEADNQSVESWWLKIERTIDGEVIRNAISEAA